MTDIIGLPEKFAGFPGVQMTPPPLEWIHDTNRLITDAATSLGDGQGALTWIATQQGEKYSVNLALVHKVGGHAHILGYFGKSWGKPIESGLVGMIRW